MESCLKGPIAILGGSPGTGKAQPFTSKILTPTGWKLMGDISVGESVIGQDGLHKKVNEIFPQGELEVFEVVFSDGSKTECCDDHLWLTKSRKERKRKSENSGSVKTLKEIRNSLDRGDGSPNHTIPMVEKVQFERKTNLPIDPYLLGVLLGDGHLGRFQIQLSNPDKEIIEECKKRIIPECEIKKNKHGDCDYYIQNASSLISKLEKYSLTWLLSDEKYIPDDYLFSDSISREELLQGLLDTDGYTDGYNIEYVTTSNFLMLGVTSLVQSLGGIVNVAIKEKPKYTYKGETRFGKRAYRMMVKIPSNVQPFKLKRKLERYIPKTKYKPTRYIKEVNPVGKKPCQCISIEGDEKLYVTDDFIVTHNTWTGANLIKALGKTIGLGNVAVAAPTGKAAVRISEVMHEHGLEITAKTWHSLLGVGEVDKVSGRFGFKHNEKNPLQYKVIIGDESSMLDTDLMASVIKARAVGTQILFLGDVNQLPPVGHGAPLRDMISAGLPYGELTEIQRNSGGIVEACAAMRDGEAWGEGDNLKIDSRPDQVESIVDQLHQAAANGYDPVWNCQVVVAVNEKSPLSRKAVNSILQEEFNENEKIKGSPFRPGDKIVCLKNGFFPLHEETGDSDEIDMDEDGRAYVANGELAKVEEVEEKFFVASLNSPDRVIKIPRGKSGGGDNSTGCSWDLGYALSVHKSQGSEWPIVIVALDEYPGARRICDRSWIYTAISRAKDSCVLVGKKSTADSMCRRQNILNRKTFLRERILLNQAKMELVEL